MIPMFMEFEIKAIMHDIDAIGLKYTFLSLPSLRSFTPHIPTILSHFKLMANWKNLKFSTQMEKNAKQKKSFGKKLVKPTRETMSFLEREESITWFFYRRWKQKRIWKK